MRLAGLCARATGAGMGMGRAVAKRGVVRSMRMNPRTVVMKEDLANILEVGVVW
jgi:hypothetical protein